MTGFPAWLIGLFSRRALARPQPTVAAPTLQIHLVQVANGQIGVHETSRNRGPGIEKYWGATTYPEGHDERQPWCAAFACWCLREAIIRRWGDEAAAPFKRCRSARAYGWIEWARLEPRADVVPGPRPGDIVVYNFSHIGIVLEYRGGSDFSAIEGNTDDAGGNEGVEVAVRRRQIKQVRAFLRLPA